VKPLIETNPYLKRKAKRDKLLARSVISSTAIERIRLKRKQRYTDAPLTLIAESIAEGAFVERRTTACNNIDIVEVSFYGKSLAMEIKHSKEQLDEYWIAMERAVMLLTFCVLGIRPKMAFRLAELLENKNSCKAR